MTSSNETLMYLAKIMLSVWLIKTICSLQATWTERNRVFATNSDVLKPISLQPCVLDLRYFKLRIL